MTRNRIRLIAGLLLVGSLGLSGTGCLRQQAADPTIQISSAHSTAISTQAVLPAPSATPLPAAADEAQFTPGQELAMLPQARGDLHTISPSAVYTIDLRVDFPASEFMGQMQLDYTNQDGVSHDRLYFRLLPNAHRSYGNGSLEVISAQVEGQAVEPEISLADSVLELALPDPVGPGDSLHIEMDFEGMVPQDFGGEDAPAGYGIYNKSDNVLALSGWYPILSVYDDQGWNLDPVSEIGDSVYSETALYSVDLTVDEDLLVAATGVEVSRQKSGDQLLLSYVSGPARDFFLVMSPDFELISEVMDGVRLNSYYLPAHQAGGEIALQVTAQSLQTFNRRFGEYPFAELDIVDAPMRNASGVEYPGIFLVASHLYDDPAQDAFLITTAHEVAHQWWYSVVGNDVFDEPWLDESLATFSSSLYYQEALGEAAYQGFAAYWQDRLEALQQDGQDDRVVQSLAYFESLNAPRVYGTVVYTKGALFLKALREEIGDQAFFGALMEYYHQYQYDVADTDALLAAFERQASRPLDDFYQEWLYSADE